MLHEFITEHRPDIIARCRALIADLPAPRPTQEELEHGVPLFLDQLAARLRARLTSTTEITETAALHANELRARGFTIAQVVRDYGGICQTITELAVERLTNITAKEFQTLNLCLDEAIAGAVTEFSRLRDSESTERLGHMAHEMRNALNTAFLAMTILKSGRVAIGGSTGALLDSSLTTLRSLVDRELAQVRLAAAINHPEVVVIRDFLEELEVAAVAIADAKNVEFSMISPRAEVTVLADKQLLASVVSNLLQNAFKFTRSNGHVTLRVEATDRAVRIAVEDQCGGLKDGQIDSLFEPFNQDGSDRSGLGLGLTISRKGTEAIGGTLTAVNKPGVGCIFVLELPRATAG